MSKTSEVTSGKIPLPVLTCESIESLDCKKNKQTNMFFSTKCKIGVQEHKSIDYIL